MSRRAWWRELRRRWPLLVAVLRGHEVAYGLTIRKGTLEMRRDGGHVLDTTIIGGDPCVLITGSFIRLDANGLAAPAVEDQP